MNTVEASRIIVVGSGQHPVTLTTNTTKLMGENVEIKVSLGAWKYFSPRVAANIQAFWKADNGRFQEGQEKAFSYAVSDEHIYKYPLQQSGVTILRVNLFIRKSGVTDIIYVQFVRIITVVDMIEQIKLSASCTSVPDTSKTVWLKHGSTVEFVLPIASRIDIEVTSNNFVTEWRWLVGYNVVSDSSRYSFEVESHDEISIVGKNMFSELHSTLLASPYAPIDSISVLGTNIVAINESSKFLVVLTSSHGQNDVIKDYRHNVSVTTTSRTLKASPDARKDRISFLGNDQMSCLESMPGPLHGVNEPMEGNSFLLHAKSYCQYQVNLTFNDYGSYTISAKATNENRQETENHISYIFAKPTEIEGLRTQFPVCVSQYSRCRPPGVKIVNPKLDRLLEFQQGRDVVIFGKYFPRSCEDNMYPTPQRQFQWEILRFIDVLGNRSRGMW